MYIWILLAVALIYVDRLTKWLAVICLEGQPSFPLIKEVLHLTYVENTGAAFGMLKDNRWVFMILTTVTIIGLCIYFFKTRPKNKWVCFAIILIIAGGIGNMIDRILLGYVIDFIDFTLINFAVFNGADSFVCVGAAILMLCIIISTVQDYKKAAVEGKATADGANNHESNNNDNNKNNTTDALNEENSKEKCEQPNADGKEKNNEDNG